MLTVVPTSEAAQTNNPYVSYNCMRQGGEKIVIGNGSHVDPIAEKIDRGYPARDALAEALLALDYEKDDYNTPELPESLGPPHMWESSVKTRLLLDQSQNQHL
jgi:Archaeal IMP cyclohydrolase